MTRRERWQGRPPADGNRRAGGRSEDWQVVFGRQPVREALRAGRPLARVVLQEGVHGGSLGELAALASERGVPVQRAPRQRLDRMAGGGHHQGVVAVVAARPLLSWEQLEEKLARSGEPPFLLLLDGIQDPGNLGAVIRVAGAAGCHAVIVPARRAAPLSPVVMRTSSGAAAHVDVVQVANLAQSVTRLGALGIAVYAASPAAEQEYTAVDYTGGVALVVGAEGTGVRPLVERRADGAVRIPMAGAVPSLNAATAAAVLCFEVVRQRRLARRPGAGGSSYCLAGGEHT